MALYTVGAWWVLVAWIGHAAVYSLLEKKEEDIESSAPEISKGLGKRVVGRGGGKEAKGKRWGSGREVFLVFLTSQMMTSRGEYHLRRQFWSQKTLVQSWSYLRSHDQHTSWDSSFDSSPCELPQGRSVATGHTCQAGEGRQQPFRLLPVVSGQLASPPTMLCIYPTSKARAAIKGRKTKTETKLTPLHPTPPPQPSPLLENLLCQNVN